MTIVGTSAGMHILGGLDYSAEHGGITSDEAMADPRHHRQMTFDSTLLAPGLTAGVITDTHFAERKRMGRLLAFLEVNVGYRGIAANEGTALLIERDARADWTDENGVAQNAKVVGQSFVYFVERDAGTAPSPANGMLRTKAHVRKVRAGMVFTYCAGQANRGEDYDLDCHDMRIYSTLPSNGGDNDNVY